MLTKQVRNAQCWLRGRDYVVRGLNATRGEFHATISPNGDIIWTNKTIVANEIARQLGKAK